MSTFKPLTAEGRFECGLMDIVSGKLAAFVAVIQPGGLGLGVAVANESGYYPIPLHWCHGAADDFERMREHADALNLEVFKLDSNAAARVVASSMFNRRTKGVA